MENPFWFVGNHLAVDFANTVVDTDQRPEAVHEWADVVSFLVRSGALSESEAKRLKRKALEERAEADAYAAALSLRDLVRELVTGLAAGSPPSPDAVRRLNAELAAAATRPRLIREDRGWRLEELPVDHSWRGALGRIARAAAELLEHPRGSIRKCANPACALYFRDASQAQARRWCSMSVCGNRAKVAAHARRAADRDREPGP